MSEDMQQDAVECATQALEKYNIEKDIAAFIKKVNDASRDLHASIQGCCLRSGLNISTVCVCARVCRGRGVGLGKAFSSSQQPSQCTHRSHTHPVCCSQLFPLFLRKLLGLDTSGASTECHDFLGFLETYVQECTALISPLLHPLNSTRAQHKFTIEDLFACRATAALDTITMSTSEQTFWTPATLKSPCIFPH